MCVTKTLQYYNENAKNFVMDTVSVDFQFIHNRFLERERGNYI